MNQKTILVIDDDEDIQLLLKKRLESHGFLHLAALTVEEALSSLSHHLPDLIILDLGFEKANGTVFLKSAKKRLPENVELPPVIVLSCYNDQNIVEYVLDLGAASFVSKPYDPSILMSTIREYIQ